MTAITMTYTEEAIGIAAAARDAGMPVVISFTVETDGTLPTGQPLGEAIEAVDAATDAYPAYYMVNCAHPTHFAAVLAAGAAVDGRVGGMRANASRMSHAELDEAEELDGGSRRAGGRLPTSCAAPSRPSHRSRRMLRHRPPSRRRDQRGLRPLVSHAAGRKNQAVTGSRDKA